MCNVILIFNVLISVNRVAKFQIARSRSFCGTNVCNFVRCRDFKLSVIAKCCSHAFYTNILASLHNIPFIFFHSFLFCILPSFIPSLLRTYYCIVNKRFITYCNRTAVCCAPVTHVAPIMLLCPSDNDNRMQ